MIVFLSGEVKVLTLQGDLIDSGFPATSGIAGRFGWNSAKMRQFSGRSDADCRNLVNKARSAADPDR
ncbi:MAG: hypothetical protein M0039_05140 [Pseudomonadota bacterium]|nr:hypothetical protein [Pseudomonadota bacterium]